MAESYLWSHYSLSTPLQLSYYSGSMCLDGHGAGTDRHESSLVIDDPRLLRHYPVTPRFVNSDSLFEEYRFVQGLSLFVCIFIRKNL